MSKKIAENDFLTYKVVKVCDGIDEKIVRPYYYDDFVYGKIDTDGIFHPEEMKNIDINIEVYEHSSRINKVETAYHSYSGNIVFNSIYHVNYTHTITVVESYIHRYTNYPINCCYPYYNIAVMECIIPKGTEYFENEFGLIASENIKPIKVYRVENMCGKFFDINS